MARKKKEKKQRRRHPILRGIVWGLFGYCILTLITISIQVYSSVIQFETNARKELELAVGLLDEQTSDVDGYADTMLQTYAQLMALLSRDSRDLYTEMDNYAASLGVESYIIVGKDAQVSHSYGEVHPSLLEQDLSSIAYENSFSAEGWYYISMPLKNGETLVIGTDTSEIQLAFTSITDRMYVLNNFSMGTASEIMALNVRTGRFVYYPERFEGLSAYDVGLPQDLASTVGSSFLWVEESSIVMSTLYKNNYLLLISTPVLSAFDDLASSIVTAQIGFGALILLSFLYSYFLHTDLRLGRIKNVRYVQLRSHKHLNTTLARPLLSFLIIGVLCTSCIVYYTQMLSRTDAQRRASEHRLEAAQQLMDEQQVGLEYAGEQFMGGYEFNARSIASVFKLKPQLINRKDLQTLARIYGFHSIYIFDERGEVVATSEALASFPLSMNPSDPTYPFWNVVAGIKESYSQPLDPQKEYTQQDFPLIGVTRYDARGMVLVSVAKNYWDQNRILYDHDSIFRSLKPENDGALLAVDPVSKLVIHSSDRRFVGQSALHLGLPERALTSGYVGTQNFNGEQCLINTAAYNNEILITAVPANVINSRSLSVTAIVVISSLIIIALTILPMLIVRDPHEDVEPLSFKRSTRQRLNSTVHITESGEVELVESIELKDNGLRMRWRRKGSSEKLRRMISLMGVVTVCWLLNSVMQESSHNTNSVINYVFSLSWDKSVNVYSIAYVIIGTMSIWLGSKVLQGVVEYVTNSFSMRWRTSGMLIANFVRYGAIIACIFFVLPNFGVETSAMMTSATVLSLVFTFGSQSLVADFMSGIFLIFEGTYRVGDIVMLDGWYGEVVEIGLRTTKVKNATGDVKIFQNSKISGAVNMTSDNSYAVCDIALPSGEELEAFERKLVSGFCKEAMSVVGTRSKRINYVGVVSSNGTNATLRLSVKCREADREALQRDLYRALKLWMVMRHFGAEALR
ncbi:MAG: mechanosensitive ion channel, partial [Eubacteriales bacterium]|nr:mechanosensitive ion channel [Eubacteriales bacterium]